MESLFSSDLWAALTRVLSLRDYNTRVVLLGVTLLGATAGQIGTFTLLRKRALIGDAASHATLPGIALAFIVMTAFGGSGKFLPGLLLGATVAGWLGMQHILMIRHGTRLKDDAALGIVLSVYFGLGMALLGVIQQMRTGHAAGLETFIYGKTASMLASDAWLIGGMAVVISMGCLAFFKEFGLLCFDQGYAAANGYPIRRLDTALMFMMVVTVVIGLQAVGLILIIALLIIPAAAARFWTDRLITMWLLAGAFGAASGFIGAVLSALAPRSPAGALIVLVAGCFFGVSLLLGARRGLWFRWRSWRRARAHMQRHHLLRWLFEWQETKGRAPVALRDVIAANPASERLWRRTIRDATRRGWLRVVDIGKVMLTEEGRAQAQRVVRNHRLWETYLIHYAAIAPHHVDRNADRIEHVLGAQMVERLEKLLEERLPTTAVLPSPHPLSEASAERQP